MHTAITLLVLAYSRYTFHFTFPCSEISLLCFDMTPPPSSSVTFPRGPLTDAVLARRSVLLLSLRPVPALTRMGASWVIPS